jgi:hypothetical protein
MCAEKVFCGAGAEFLWPTPYTYKFSTLYKRAHKSHSPYSYNCVLGNLKLHASFERGSYFEAFVRDVCNAFITFPSLLGTVGNLVPARNIRNFNLIATVFN